MIELYFALLQQPSLSRLDEGSSQREDYRIMEITPAVIIPDNKKLQSRTPRRFQKYTYNPRDNFSSQRNPSQRTDPPKFNRRLYHRIL